MVKINLITNAGRTAIMVSDSKTIRQILEDNDVNYSVGVVGIDGISLRPGDMDKTLSEFGIDEKCYLSCVCKADNAAQITIVGDCSVVTSTMKLEDIQTVGAYDPNLLILDDEDTGKPFFGVDISDGTNSGRINANGITFANVPNANGFATLTLDNGGLAATDAADRIVNKYGRVIQNLEMMEELLPEYLDSIKQYRDEIKSKITIL